MNRRGFLSSLIAVPAAAWLAPNVLATSASFPICQIETATYNFWRNQATLGATRPLTLEMIQDTFDKCSRGSMGMKMQ